MKKREIQIREEEYLQEVFPPWMLLTFVQELVTFLVQALQIYLFSTKDKKLSSELTEILSKEKRYRGPWKVYVLSIPGQEIINAFSFGIGRKDVFITKGLMKMLTKREIMAVLLHESAHSLQLHVVQQLATKYAVLTILYNLVNKYVLKAVSKWPSFLSNIFVIVVFVLAPQVITARTAGRWHEYISDSYAAKVGYGKELVSALKKLTKYIKKQCNTKGCKALMKVSSVLDAHPSLENRMKNIFEKIGRKTGRIKITDIVGVIKRELGVVRTGKK